VTAQTTTAQSGRAQIIRELYELIAALDRRVPQVERVGETSIARAAAALKSDALKRIEDLERDVPLRNLDVMTLLGLSGIPIVAAVFEVDIRRNGDGQMSVGADRNGNGRLVA